MASTIGKISFQNGSFFIKHPDGSIEVAKLGDVLKEGDVLIGSSSNSNSNLIKVILSDNSQEVEILGNNEQLFDITLLSGEILEDTVVEDKALDDLLEQTTRNIQEKPSQEEEATLTLEEIEKLDAAAAGGDQTTAEPVGIIPLRLEDRTAGETDITTDLRNSTTTTTTVDEDEDNRPLLVEEEVLPIDDAPTTGINPNVSLDDDTLSIDSIGNPLSVNFGQNGAGSVILSSITADSSFGFTSSVTGNVMTVIQNGVSVITITLNNVGGTYTYDVNQIAAINHPDGTTEDNINFSVNYVVTDVDGDIATGTFDIIVNDSIPTITVDGTATVAEDVETISGTWNANAGADGASSTVVVIGSTEYALGTAIDTGKGTLTVNTNGTWTFDPVTGLDQDTVQSVTFSVKVTDNDGDVASDDHTITITDGTGPSIDSTANSITLTTDEADMATDDTETLTFTLGSDALESIAFGTDLTALVSDTNEVVGTDVVWTRTSDTVITGTIGGTTAITLTLTPNLNTGTASVKADIADNFDSVLGNNGTNTLSLGSVSVVATDIDGDIATGTVNVEVIDDVPTITVSGGTTIAEDAVDNVATTDVNESIVTGTWDNANAGADEAASTVVVIGTTEYALGTAIDTGKGTLTVNTNGTWTFDPVTGLDQDTVQSVTFSVKVTDNDGDVASDNHTITITDGTGPSIDPNANSITLTTNEAAMATDDTDTLTFTLGSDALASIKFGTDLTALVSDTNGTTEAGNDVVWTRTSDTVITGTIGGTTAITLTLTPNLNTGTASVKADIADNFDSVFANNSTNTLSLGSVSVVATDIDGDTATGTVNVEVIDDVPTISVSGTSTVAEDAVGTISGTWDTTNYGADGAATTVVVIGSTEYALGSDITLTEGTLNVATNGTWTFDPNTGLDQTTSNPTVTFSVKVTDNDGDVASDNHTITITDGTGPSIDPNANSITLTTNEAAMATDDTDTLTFTLGSDALASIKFGTDLTALVSDTNGTTEAGNDVVWTRTSDTVITGTIGGTTAITLTLTPNLNTGTASVKADIADNFDSVLGNNGTNTLSLGSVSVVATDIDGDIATGTVNVEVIDDVPTISVSGTSTVAEDAVGTISGTWDTTNYGADGAATTVVVIGSTEYALGSDITLTEGTLNVATNGTWTFDLNTGLDQTTSNPTVTFSVKVTDNDGDVASDNHTITITDGTGPSIDPNANSITLTTNEAAMATDDTDTLTFTLGSDALASIKFGTDLTALVSDTNGTTEAGNDVVWTRTSDTVITGTIGGQTAITLTLTPNLTAGTASVKADIADNFDSVLGNNGTNTLSLGSVSVVATDIDGDIATGTVNVEVIDDVPTVNFTDAINNTTTPTVATGTWSETIGADNNSTTLGADVELNWVKVNNVLIPTTTFTFDNSSNTGSGTFVYDGTTYNFDLTLNNNGTYEVVAASLPQTIEINYNEFSSSIKASGPTDTYIVEYQDADTKDIYSAKIYAEVEGNSLSLVNYVNSTTTNIIPSTTVGSTINVSATGIGLGNNVLESYYKNGVYTSESLYFNPDNETNLITLNFTGTGANAFGSGDVIYIELTGVDGTVQTVLLDSVHGDFIVNSDNSLTPISNTYTGGNLSSYSVSLSNGEAIDYVKVTTGFSGTTETNVKLAFSYSVSETVTFNEDLSMNFTATITDADNDQDSIDFDVQFNKVDLIPESTDKVFDMTLGDTKETVNVVITLDLSGSMDDDINDTTRLALAKDAIENMLNAYADNYIVNVKLVTFSDSGTSYDWILNDVDTAIATVNSLNTGNSTNYEAGVSATYSNYTEPTADKTVAYFISDGAPTSENNEGRDVWFNVGTDSESGWLDTSYKTAWNTFVDTYVDELNVIAVNSGTFSTTYLDALASAEQGNNTIVITDEYQLSNILVNLASEQISGNAYSTISGGNGVISIDAIEVNGTTYNASDYTSSNNTVTLNNWNGTLTFNFSNGAYTYVTSADKFTQDLEKSFKIFASDADGDTTSFDVKINVDIDDTASTPTLDMNISDVEVVSTLNPIPVVTYLDRTISKGETYPQTISLGSEYANKTVTISFDARSNSRWEGDDTFRVYNGTVNSNNLVKSYNDDFNVNNYTFTVLLNSNGEATINFVSGSDKTVETVSLSDFKVLSSVESYHYTIALDAELTDNGETLSDITLDNLPAGTTIDGLTANVDGSYTIDINSSGDATVTLISPTQLDPSSLNSITASVTSKDGTDSSTITVNKDFIVSIEAGAGDDTIDYNGTEKLIDGGAGNDILKLMNGDDIDFSNLDNSIIKNIEKIDLSSDTSANLLTKLTLSDVMDMTPQEAGITHVDTGIKSTDHILKITAGSNDIVTLIDKGLVDNTSDNWVKSNNTFTDTDNTVYNVFTSNEDSSYKVLIQNTIETTITNS